MHPGMHPGVQLQAVPQGVSELRRSERTQYLRPERDRELRRDCVADLPVARVDWAAKAVPVGEALDARVLADREDAILVGAAALGVGVRGEG